MAERWIESIWGGSGRLVGRPAITLEEGQNGVKRGLE